MANAAPGRFVASDAVLTFERRGCVHWSRYAIFVATTSGEKGEGYEE
jgi:hypothetical protein